MKHPTKKGGGTLREYRVLGYRVTLETFSERTAKRWQVTVFDEAAAMKRIADDWTDAAKALLMSTGEGAANLWTSESNGSTPVPKMADAYPVSGTTLYLLVWPDGARNFSDRVGAIELGASLHDDQPVQWGGSWTETVNAAPTEVTPQPKAHPPLHPHVVWDVPLPPKPAR